MIRSTRRKYKDVRRFRVQIALSVMCGLALIILICIQTPYARLQEVRVQTEAGQERPEVEGIVAHILFSRHWLIFPQNVRYFFPKKTISKSIMLESPTVSSVRFEESGEVLTVYVTEREVRARLCIGGDDCYQLDHSGFIFKKSEPFAVYDRTYRGPLASTSPIGATFLKDDFPQLAATLDKLEVVAKRKIIEVEIEDSDVYATFGTGGEVWFLLKREPDTLVTDVEALLASPAFKSYSAFAYLDFRFPNRALVGDLKSEIPPAALHE